MLLHHAIAYYLPCVHVCSVLEAVHPQPTSSRVDDYSRLELTGHLDLGPPKKPSPYKRPTNKGQ